MPLLNRDDQARVGSIHLGKDTKRFIQPTIDEVKEEIGLTNFLKRSFELYIEKPELFEDIKKRPL